MKGRRVGSDRSITSVAGLGVAVLAAREGVGGGGGCLCGSTGAVRVVVPAGVAMESAVAVGMGDGERMSVRSAFVGSVESSCGVVNDRYDCVTICSRSSKPSNSYPGRCSPGNNRRVNIFGQ